MRSDDPINSSWSRHLFNQKIDWQQIIHHLCKRKMSSDQINRSLQNDYESGFKSNNLCEDHRFLCIGHVFNSQYDFKYNCNKNN